jgi:hypothetical protein
MINFPTFHGGFPPKGIDPSFDPSAPIQAERYKIMEAADVFATHYVRDANDQIAFISLVGRDTAVSELLARLSLKLSEGGIRSFTLADGLELQIAPERMEKTQMRYDNTPFGHLVHTFLYKDTVGADASKSDEAILLFREDDPLISEDLQQEGLWHLVKNGSKTPLANDWANAVIEFLFNNEMLVRLDKGMGLFGWQLKIRDDELTNFVSRGLQTGNLSVETLLDRSIEYRPREATAADETQSDDADSPWGEVISCYTISDAVADGTMVRINSHALRDAGINLEMVMSFPSWQATIGLAENAAEQDEILWQLVCYTAEQLGTTAQESNVHEYTFPFEHHEDGISVRLRASLAFDGPESETPLILLQLASEPKD